MNQHNLEYALNAIFEKYHSPAVRYKHLAFSSNDFSQLDLLQTTLKNQFPHYDVWDEFESINTMPECGISRADFLKQLFSHNKELLLFSPESWLRFWSLLDQQTFWSQLAIRHGNKNIVLVFAKNTEFSKQNHHSFSPVEMPNTAFTLWTSSKNRLDN